MELPNKLFKKIAFITRPQIEEHMLIVMDKSTHEEHLSQPVQTNNKQFKIAVLLLTGYNGIFNVTYSNKKFYFKKTITDGDYFVQITISPGAYDLESLNAEIKRIIIDEGHFAEADHTFTIKPNFSTLGSIIEKSPQGPIVSFVFDDSIRSLLGFHENKLYKENNLSPNPVDILSFDNIFLETNLAQGMIVRGKRSGTIHIWTLTVDLGNKYVEKFACGISWYMKESKDFVSSISFK